MSTVDQHAKVGQYTEVPSSDVSRRRGPLRNLRVVDLTTSYAGPTATMYLADLGADVIKVERPGTGDDARQWGPPFTGSASAWFGSANRNKRSVVLDLGSAAGQEALLKLIATADVLVENFNPAKLKSLGVDYPTLRARFPRLIYCAMSGFGLTGPDHARPGYDLAAQARSGLMSVTGQLGGPPQRVSTALSDVVTGMCAAIAVCAAVVEQQVTGNGDLVDVSLLDSDLALMAPRIAAYLAGEPEPAPSGGTDSVLAIYQPFKAADREIVVAIGNDKMWARFCQALGLEENIQNAELRSNAGRKLQRPVLIPAIADRIVTRPASEWVELLEQAGVPCSVVQTLSEVVSDPQVVERRSLMPDLKHDGLFTVRSPFRLDSIPDVPNEPYPELGQDTEDVLKELDLTVDEIGEIVSVSNGQTGSD
ncbi:CoA transferase [Nocardioides endophyticus]|uniref:CoA transferase n=1 Tax=Nocardioides endophyticus TaxID=1353775 RepID=A0ABP8YI85_9ACTN